jgi:hypothetical protein
MRLKIYAGLSLTARDVARVLPGALAAPPIKRGELGADLAAGYQVIGIVDGEFHQALAVTPTEVLDALRCGVKVYGASSMGALRAVELEPFGMIGSGEIFEALRARPYFADDHLGQIYLEGHGEAPSLPMVELALQLQARRRAGRIDATKARRIERAYLRMHFAERSLAALRARFASDPVALCAIRSLGGRTASVKRRDGLGLLRLIRRDLDDVRTANRAWTLARVGRPGRAR